ncbi:MAG: uroporphyrinogen-III synthase [Anaerolineales bacterium]|nr:uroporphyrinogen-III synthase [Anaerolineales bacterium]
MRVLITRPKNQARAFSQALERIGVEPVFLPTIAIEPLEDTSLLDQALSRLDGYYWLVLTSANAVDVVLTRLAALKVDSLPDNLRVAAIGPKTAARLEKGGISPDFIPDRYIAEAIIPGLGDLADRWVLLPLADIAHHTLANAIQAADGVAHVITAYHNLLAEPDPQGLAALKAGVDVLTFTSGSTVQNFYTMVQNAGLDPLHLPAAPKVACIGPKTAHAARRLGFRVDVEAQPHTSEGLVTAVQTLAIRPPFS